MVLSGEVECESFRICCYGSSSKKTPDRYLSESHSLGKTLAKRGHTCVNGAGSHGCMGSLNAGVKEGNGDVVGVIHKMFLVDGGDWMDKGSEVFLGCKKEVYTGNAELLVAGGRDLQQRKKMLLNDADGVIVLPGGTGTFDELWEIACSRNLGIVDIPIVCVNVDGYYDSFVAMLQRAYDDEILNNKPHDVVHFETSSVLAVRWIEAKISEKWNKDNTNSSSGRKLKLRERPSILSNFFSMEQIRSNALPLLLAFIGGLALGVKSAGRKSL